MSIVNAFSQFTFGSARIVTRGSFGYFAWLAALLALIVTGAIAYAGQFQED